MPRTLPIANGNLHVSFDHNYCVRDIYHYHLGLNNQTGGVPWRLGVWADGRISWVQDESWQRRLCYEAHDSLVTEVRLGNENLQIEIVVNDAIAPDADVFVRKFSVTNRAEIERDIRLFLNSRLRIEDNADSVAVYYDPERRAMFHYKGEHWFCENGKTVGANAVGVGQFTCGEACVRGSWGTFEDAEDGWLEGRAVAQGEVDATIGFGTKDGFGSKLGAGETATVYYWLAGGKSHAEAAELDDRLTAGDIEDIFEKTRAAAKNFLSEARADFQNTLPQKEVADLYHRSLLTLSTLADTNGAIVAAADSDERYGYVWGRDGALNAHAVSRAGLQDIPRRFFQFINRSVREYPWLWQKFNPDGTSGASWHPWTVDGKPVLPVQEDETALVLWALADYLAIYKDKELIDELYESLVKPAADWMAKYRDEQTRLPDASWDLWEERRGVHLWTCAAVVAGLRGACRIAEARRKKGDAKKWNRAAEEIADAIERFFWSEKSNRYVRSLTDQDGEIVQEETLDISMCGLFLFGCKRVDDERVRATVEAMRDGLRIKTDVGGYARYAGDRYQRVAGSDGDERVPGNPWFVCSLWIAQADIAAAKSIEQLENVREMLDWACAQGDDAKILAEQINPYTGESLSVSPLAWSHAEVVRTVNAYLDKSAELTRRN